MTTITFDTHAYVKTLREAGFTEPQAEAQTNALATAMFAGELATKQDLSLMERNLKQEVDALRKETKQDIRELALATKHDIQTLGQEMRETELHIDARMEALKSDLIKWVVGLALAQVGLLVGILLKLAH